MLAHPASVDSIPTSADKEDHVSMSPIAARKFAAIVANLERVLAIELLVAFQAMEFLRPLTSSPPLEQRPARASAGRARLRTTIRDLCARDPGEARAVFPASGPMGERSGVRSLRDQGAMTPWIGRTAGLLYFSGAGRSPPA